MASAKKESNPIKPGKSLTSLALSREREGWVVHTIITQDGKVISHESTEPDLKMCAISTFKVKSLEILNQDG
jgi:hypothetical protein